MESEVPDVFATEMKEQLVEKSRTPSAAAQCGRLRPSIHVYRDLYTHYTPIRIPMMQKKHTIHLFLS